MIVAEEVSITGDGRESCEILLNVLMDIFLRINNVLNVEFNAILVNLVRISVFNVKINIIYLILSAYKIVLIIIMLLMANVAH